jgi:ABC-2 type transport system permease protein
MEYSGMGTHPMKGMLFSYGCAYMQMIFVALIYNSFGSDGAGVQFYFLAPLRMRDAILAKNLMVFGIFAMEAALIYVASAKLAAPSPLAITVATLAWSLFTLFLNMSIGNVRSIVSPKGVDPLRVRNQNVSGLSSLISLGVVAASVGLGIAVYFLCHWMKVGYWPAAAVFTVLAGVGFVPYAAVLGRIDGIAASHAEDLTRELSKAQ